MATVTIVPDGDITSAWTSGGFGDIDQGVSTPNDSLFTTITGLGAEGQIDEFSLTSPGLSDADTINGITINFRAQNNGGAGNDRISTDLRIGGTLRGVAASANLSTSGFADQTGINNAAWDADWTASELDGMQLQAISAQQGMNEALAIELSEIEVVIDFTPATDVLMAQVMM